MEHALRFGDILEAADHLTFEEQEELIEIVQKRMIAKRRSDLLADVKDAESEYREGRCEVISADEAVKRLVP